MNEPDEPPHVLYAGRLSEEKGILEFLEATAGLPRVIVGDGPLRARVPEAVGFVPPREVGGYYERAAVVCVPSRREGYGFTAREAMAYARPVVASRVGGLGDLDQGATLVATRRRAGASCGTRAPARRQAPANDDGSGGARGSQRPLLARRRRREARGRLRASSSMM